MWESLQTAEDIERAATELFGASLTGDAGVSHVTALWEPKTDAPLLTIRVDADSPKDPRDWFALNISRARADAIVVTGKTLRDEPNLSYNLPRLKHWGPAMAKWRTQFCKKPKPPILLVLSRGRDLRYDHPALHGWATPIVFTSDRAASRYLCDAPCRVIADGAPDLHRAIAHLATSQGATTISIEAGPSTSQTLYAGSSIVDEVLLSVYKRPDLPKRHAGRPLWSMPELRSRFSSQTQGSLDDETWQFHRFQTQRP